MDDLTNRTEERTAVALKESLTERRPDHPDYGQIEYNEEYVVDPIARRLAPRIIAALEAAAHGGMWCAITHGHQPMLPEAVEAGLRVLEGK